MPPTSKRKQQSQLANAKRQAKYCKIKEWKDLLKELHSHEHKLKNPQGRVCENEENKMIMLVLLGILEQRLNEDDAHKITWTPIEREASNMLHCHISHVTSVHKQFEKHKVIPHFDIKGRGGASETYDRDRQSTIKQVTLVEIAKYVDEMHSKGCSVTNKKVRGMLKSKFELKVTRRSIQRAMKKLGL
jgi:transposase